MPFDGNGNFVRIYNWVNDRINGINITASRVDAEENGFAAGLTNCVTRDGQGKPTADYLPAVSGSLNLGSAALAWATLNGMPLPVGSNSILAFYPQTAGESAAGVTPTHFNYPPGNILRYGADPTGGSDSWAAIQAAINSVPTSGGSVYVPPGSSFTGYKVSQSLVIPSNLFFGLRLYGEGYSSALTITNPAVDLLTWANPGGGAVAVPYTVIERLRFNGNSGVGGGNLINTQFASSVRITQCFFWNFCTTGSAITVEGNGATYSHEVLIAGCYFDTTSGLAMINLTATSSDSYISDCTGNGRNGCQYGMFVDFNSSNCHVDATHLYGCTKYSLNCGESSGSSFLFTGCTFDSSTLGCVLLNGTIDCMFSCCSFEFPPAATWALTLTNAAGNRFDSCDFEAIGGGTSQGAVQETGTSDQNLFQGCQLHGTWASGSGVTLLGNNSAYRTGSDIFISGVAGALAAATTVFAGYGAANPAENKVQVPIPVAATIRSLIVECDVAPGTSQSFTCTVRLSGVNTSLVATVSGSSFGATANGFVSVPAQGSVDVQIVSSAAAATSNVRVAIVLNT